MGLVGPSSQHALQDCVSVSGSALRWSGGPSRHPWQHPRTRPWLSCCRPVVGCPDCPPGSACSPPWQEAGSSPGHPWKHPRPCPWIRCCRPVVGCPDRSPGSACSPPLAGRRGLPPSTPLGSPLLPVPTTPSATWPPWCPSDTSTLPATLLVSVLPSALDTPTAKHQGWISPHFVIADWEKDFTQN